MDYSPSVWVVRLLSLSLLLWVLVLQVRRQEGERDQSRYQERLEGTWESTVQELREQLRRKHDEDRKQFRLALELRRPPLSMAELRQQFGALHRVH